jgi:hypothetical protein
MNFQDPGPFTIFTFIAGPAVLTNASSVLALSTSNRFARSIDRARELAHMLEAGEVHEPEMRVLWQEMLGRAHRTAQLLLISLCASYVALGSFAGSTLLSVLSAVLSLHGNHFTGFGILTLSFVIGGIGFVGLVIACIVMIREVFLTLVNVRKESRVILAQVPVGKEAGGSATGPGETSDHAEEDVDNESHS